MAENEHASSQGTTGDDGMHMSAETEKRLKEFEEQLRRQEELEAQRAAMPDTSVAGGAQFRRGELDVLEDYYPKHDIPIYESGLNKQIDRIDMEIDRNKRTRRTEYADPDADMYMARIRAAVAREDSMTEEEREAERQEKHKRDSRFVIYVPIAIVIIALVFIAAVYFAG